MDQQVQDPGRGTERQESAQRQGKSRADAAGAVEPVDVQGHAGWQRVARSAMRQAKRAGTEGQ
eukprot:1300644-Pleurochrysis_carterae.AAC.1